LFEEPIVLDEDVSLLGNKAEPHDMDEATLVGPVFGDLHQRLEVAGRVDDLITFFFQRVPLVM
jgi:hypothetical protein